MFPAVSRTIISSIETGSILCSSITRFMDRDHSTTSIIHHRILHLVAPEHRLYIPLYNLWPGTPTPICAGIREHYLDHNLRRIIVPCTLHAVDDVNQHHADINLFITNIAVTLDNTCIQCPSTCIHNNTYYTNL